MSRRQQLRADKMRGEGQSFRMDVEGHRGDSSWLQRQLWFLDVALLGMPTVTIDRKLKLLGSQLLHLFNKGLYHLVSGFL